MTKVSVIIPTFKREAYLEKCLESLMKQKREVDEIIVVGVEDDDQRSQVVRRIMGNYPASKARILELTIKEPNIVCAENHGLKFAQGEVVCFIDDDAIAREDWLYRILEHYDANPAIGAVGGPVIPLTGSGPVEEHCEHYSSLTWYGKKNSCSEKIPPETEEVPFLRGANMSFKKIW